MADDKADFVAKLRQIEELANVAVAELPHGLMMLRTRVQHIVVLAKTLRGRLELGAMTIVRVEPGAPLGERDSKPPA